MKYSVFALFALALFSLASCQNTPSDAYAEGASPISSVEPSADPKKLSEQILTDMLAGKKEVSKYAADHKATFELIRSMKVSWGSQGETEKAHIEKLVKDAMVFFEAYQIFDYSVNQLDSLSANVMAGTINLDEAQNKYKLVRKEMQKFGGRLQPGQEKVKAVKSEWERDFPELSKQNAAPVQ